MVSTAEIYDLKLNSKYCLADHVKVKAIFEGIKEDMELFYLKFIETNNLSFVSFASIWRDLKFPSVFGCRKHPTELIEFTDGLITYGKAFLFSIQLPASLFGLYFIYAVCFKQTNKCMYSKLRLTLEELEILRKALEKMYLANHIDTQYIFKKLHESGCIMYVASPLEAGIEEGFSKYFGTTEEDRPSIPSQSKALDTSLLDTLETVNNLYGDLKQQVYDDREQFFSSSDFVSKVREQLNRLSPLQIAKVETENNNDSTGAQRQALKMKSYSKKSNAQETPQLEEGKSSKPKQKKQLRTKSTKMEFLTEEPEALQVESGPEEDGQLPTI